MTSGVQRIGLSGQRSSAGLFKALEGIFPVRFEPRAAGEYQGLDAVVLIQPGREELQSAKRAGLPVYGDVEGSEPPQGGEGTRIRFADAPTLDWPLRGRQMTHPAPLNLRSIVPGASESAVAFADERPIWVAGKPESPVAYAVSAGLPELKAGEGLRTCLNGSTFMQLLPMVQFLRQVSGSDGWVPPGPRAAFMFDDPNLHGDRYGYVDYRSVAQHASRQNYHVSFATIPLDSWFASGKAAAVFAEHRARLSLLIHGNNHVRNELSSFPSEEQRIRSLAQALRRIARLEERTGLRVSRVMAAPHGACSVATLQGLARLGFEAACISHGSLCFYNPGEAWVGEIGLRASEMVAGLPVIPRFRLSASCHNSILLAAYLNQPIIPVGHHGDVAGGPGLLGDLANFINALGEVRWLDMRGMARSNYATRREDSLLRVKPYARAFEVTVPSGVEELAIDPAWVGAVHARGIRLRAKGQAEETVPEYGGQPLRVQAGSCLEITPIHEHPIDPASVGEPPLNLWAFARRQLSECRDRLAPKVGLRF